MADSLDSSINEENLCLLEPQPTVHDVEIAPKKCDVSQRLLLEKKELTEFDPLPFVETRDIGDSLFEWIAVFTGPPNTVYEGGTFIMSLSFTKEYPVKPPTVTFLTRIYHCNFNAQGKMYVEILNNWTSNCHIRDILESVYKLLQNCDPFHPLVEKIARQYLCERDLHDAVAKEWTLRFAQ